MPGSQLRQAHPMRPILSHLHPASRCFRCVAIMQENDFFHVALYDDVSVTEIKNRAKESVLNVER